SPEALIQRSRTKDLQPNAEARRAACGAKPRACYVGLERGGVCEHISHLKRPTRSGPGKPGSQALAEPESTRTQARRRPAAHHLLVARCAPATARPSIPAPASRASAHC